MKKTVLILVFAFSAMTGNAFSQLLDTSRKKENKKTEPYLIVKKTPDYPGGAEALNNYLKKHIKYPLNAKKKGIQGTVLVKFIVNKDGSVSDVKVVQGIGGGCDQEAVRVVKLMPKWKPGTQNKIPVSCYFTLPIKFTLK